MEHVESSFSGFGSLNIYYQKWLPEEEVKAVLLVVHGYAEHGGRYGNLVSYFLPDGYGMYALDQRGHGRSEGKIDEVGAMSDFVSDLKTFFDIVREENPGKKIFVIGHSMGSVISLQYTLQYQDEFDGLILSGGGMSKPDEVPMPVTTSSQPLDSSYLSHDPEVIRDYENDPLVYRGPIPESIQIGMLQGREQLPQEVRQIRIPVLVMAGDAVTDGERSQVLYDYIGSDDKAIKRYAGLRHEIFNEPEYPVVLGDVKGWLEARL